jgi:hypothetical protein
MNWPDDDVDELSGRGLLMVEDRSGYKRPSFANISIVGDETCPKGIIWISGRSIVRVDPNTHDAHVGAVGGE